MDDVLADFVFEALDLDFGVVQAEAGVGRLLF